MFELIKVDPQLADAVEKELCFSRPQWQYSPITTNYFDFVKDEDTKRSISTLKDKFPIKDTQKFSDTFYNSSKAFNYSFTEIRFDPQSRYNKQLPIVSLQGYANWITKEYRDWETDRKSVV